MPLVALPTRPAAGERPAGDVVPPTVEEIYELGCDLDEADPERAESSYRQVIAQAPQHADAHINLGRILHERGDLPGAEKHYRRALAIRPHDPTASFNLGVVLEDGGHHAEALEAYQRAIAADERNADAHYNAARLYDLLGDYASALRHLRICRDLARRQALADYRAAARACRRPRLSVTLSPTAGERSPSFPAARSSSSTTIRTCVTPSPPCWSTRATASPAWAAGARRCSTCRSTCCPA